MYFKEGLIVHSCNNLKTLSTCTNIFIRYNLLLTNLCFGVLQITDISEQDQLSPSKTDIVDQQPLLESKSNQKVKSEVSCDLVGSSNNSLLLASDQSVAWIEEEFLTEDLSDLDSLKEQGTISVEVTPYGLYPRKDSIISYQQDSCSCQLETSSSKNCNPVQQDCFVQDNSCDIGTSQTVDCVPVVEDLIVQEDNTVSRSETEPTFPVGPLQSFDYYHYLIAEDLNIIDIMEKVGMYFNTMYMY